MWHTHQPTGLSSCNTFETVVQKPVIVVVQVLAAAIALVHQADAQKRNKLVRGLVLAGPPAWAVITRIRLGSKKLIWNSRFSFR